MDCLSSGAFHTIINESPQLLALRQAAPVRRTIDGQGAVAQACDQSWVCFSKNLFDFVDIALTNPGNAGDFVSYNDMASLWQSCQTLASSSGTQVFLCSLLEM